MTKDNDVAGIVQSFWNLHVLGTRNLDMFKNLPGVPAQLEQLATWGQEIKTASSLAHTARKTPSETKPLRDRVFTHLKQAVDEVRVCGRFAFKGNKERLAGYRSTYLRQKSNQQKIRQKALKAEKENINGEPNKKS
ncbi:MAG: hypothetical protein GY765_42800 [bacterium]|nr:hypothetical protein [bacterium]